MSDQNEGKEKGIIEKLGINTETKIVTEDRWSGCGGCIYFTIDEKEPIFCGLPRHKCNLNKDDEKRNVCFEDKIIYKIWPLSDKEKLFNEMLEALIDEVLFQENICLEVIDEAYQNMIVVIQKATGKSWSEIKELL